MSEGEPILRLEHVGRTFDGGTITALDNVSLTIERGALIGVHGPSGSGKSTLLSTMAGLDMPTSGEVRFAGRSGLTANQWTALRAEAIGIVFQDFNLLPTLTASENVQIAMFGAAARPAERERRAAALLDEVGIAPCAARFPAQLSGGERQRVSVARSIANAPELLLADEPTSNLDSKAGAAVMKLLLALQRTRGLALVIVTHDAKVLRRCPRRVQMIDGRVVEDARH